MYCLAILTFSCEQHIIPSHWEEWFPLLGLAVIVHAMGQGLIAVSLKHLSATFSAITMMITPVEETGIMIAKDSGIEILGCYSGFAEGKSDHSLVFVIRNIEPMNSSLQSIEIDDCSFFAYEEIPRTVSPGTYRRLREYVKEIPISYEW